MPKTLSFYLAGIYVRNAAIMLFGLMALIYFFDVVELIRRASKFDDVPLGLVLQMGLYKLPKVTQMIFPFVILFAAIYTFWGLSQRLELVIIRASGFSSLQFLLPLLSAAFLIGAFQVSAINPLGAFLIGQFERLESVHLKRQQSQIALFQDGLWLRQDVGEAGDYVILHSLNVRPPDFRLYSISGFVFGADNALDYRFDAAQGAGKRALGF